MGSYRVSIASHVGGTDPSGNVHAEGMALELYSPDDDDRVAEVFLNEESGSRTVTVFGETPIPEDVMVWFLEQAKALL